MQVKPSRRVKGYPHPVHLIHGNRTESQILYRDEVEALAGKLDFKFDPVPSEPPEGWQGRLGAHARHAAQLPSRALKSAVRLSQNP
jgi:NAD(P)H-flavin reductase